MKNGMIDVIPLNFGKPDGGDRYTLVGFESDGTVWIQPDDLGIEPEQGNALLDFPQPWLIVDEKRKLVFIHWRAAAKLFEPAERAEKWLRFAATLFTEYQRICAYESSRNN